MSGPDPELSVVIVVGNLRRRGARALASVLRQGAADRIELLLVDCGAEDVEPLPGSDHPVVRIIRMPPTTDFGTARAHATRQARAPVVVFLEEHCEAQAGWAEGLIDAHREGWSAVASQIQNLNPHEGASDVVFVTAYAPWMHPSEGGRRDALPGHNVSFKRDVLLDFGDELGELLLIDTILLQQLAQQGHDLCLAPDATHAHLNETGVLRFFPIYWHWNRCFGSLRARHLGWSRLHRVGRVLATPLLPFVRYAKLLALVGRHHREHLGVVLRGAPVVFGANLVAGLGQAVGLIFGAGDSPQRFSDLEINLARTSHGDE